MTAMSEMLELAKDVPVGSTAHIVCPACNGGSSGEVSLSVSRTEAGIAWYCHRASCNSKGMYFGASPVASPEQREYAPPTVPKWETGEATEGNISPQLSSRLKKQLGVEAPYILLYHGVSAVLGGPEWPDTLLFEARGIAGELTGYQTRRERAIGGKICRNYKLTSGPMYGFYSTSYSGAPNGDALWLVEDPISAIKLAERGVDAVCLFGTVVPRAVIETAARQYKRFLLALDRDASIRAIADAQRLRQNTGIDILPVLLRKDIKNMTSEELSVLLAGNP